VTRFARVEPVSVSWTKPTLSAAAQRAVTARPAGRAGPRRAPFIVLICGLLTGGLCVLVVLNTASAAAELRRHDVTAANAGLAEDVEQLRSQLAANEAPDALAAAAAKLGMVPNGDPGFLIIRPDGKASVLGSPTPAAPAAVPVPATPAPRTTRPPARSEPTASGRQTPARTLPSPQPAPTPKPSPTPVTQAPLPGGPR
jgi:hypothetical protein